MSNPAPEGFTPAASPSAALTPNAEALAFARTAGISGGKPYHYGFNCRPRQVRSYEVERSVEAVMAFGSPEANALLCSRIHRKWSEAKAKWTKALHERNRSAFSLSAYRRRTLDRSLGRTSDRLLNLERAMEALTGLKVTPHWQKEAGE